MQAEKQPFHILSPWADYLGHVPRKPTTWGPGLSHPEEVWPCVSLTAEHSTLTRRQHISRYAKPSVPLEAEPLYLTFGSHWIKWTERSDLSVLPWATVQTRTQGLYSAKAAIISLSHTPSSLLTFPLYHIFPSLDCPWGQLQKNG